MKARTSDYKNNVKLFGRELDSKITYTIDGVDYELGSDQLNSVTPHYEGAILKSVMRQLDIDSNAEIPVNTVINYQFGVKVNNSYEYINFGNYIVYQVEKQEDTESYKITCYDKMLLSMVNYTLLGVTYPVTIRDYIGAICQHLGLTFKNTSDTFANYDREINNELYLDAEGNSLGYTFRDVLDELAQVTASTICINEDDDELEIRYINDTEDTINEEYLKDVNVNFGEKYGPVNSIVLSRAGEADNVYLRDEESVTENGLCEIKIKENQIMNFNDRSDYLPDILEALDGLEYYLNDFSSTGITYFDLCDKYNVEIGENTYSCIMFNDEVLVTQGLEENVYTEMPEQSETEYKKADKTDQRINQTYLIVNKQNGEIESLTSRTTNLESQTQNMYSIEQINQLIQTAETGVTNTFSEAGGNNIFRNTGLWFESSDSDSINNPYEYWTGVAVKRVDIKASNRALIILQNGDFIQEQEVANGNYCVSFKYKKLIDAATVKVFVNDVEYSLIETTDTEFELPISVRSNHINVRFNSICQNNVRTFTF